MTGKTHTYACSLAWTGNTGEGTASYTGYSRDHVFSAPDKPDLLGSSDPAFRGDRRRYNPEELLVAGSARAPRAGRLDLYRMRAPRAAAGEACE